MPMRAPKWRGSAAIVIVVSDAARNNGSYTTALFCQAMSATSAGRVKTTWK